MFINTLRTFITLSVFLFVASFPAVHGEVYTWINKDGVREYGDEPPQNAKKAKLPAIQSLPKETFSKQKQAEKNAAKDSDFSGYKKLMILNPKQDYAVTAGAAGSLQVELALEPSLQAGHEITLFLDGKPVATGAQLQFSLDNLNRGSHMIHAHIKHQGTLLVSTPKRRFHVQRPSILNRARAQ